MASSLNRITGLASGLDVDSIVQETMNAYKVKVTKQKQEKTLLEMKQQLYRDLIKEGRDFYNKYFDVTKSDSLLNSKNYTSIKFTSSDNSVCSVDSSSTAVKDNYTVNVEQLAKNAKIIINSSDLTSSGDMKITSGGKSVLIKASEFDKCSNDKEKAKLLNSKLDSIGMKAVSSDFSKGNIIIETKNTGKDASFTIDYGTVTDEKVEGNSTSDLESKEYSLSDLLKDDASDLQFSNGDKTAIIKASDIKSAVSSIQSKIDEITKKLDDDVLTDGDKDAINKQIEELKKEKDNVVASTINSKLSSIGLKCETVKDDDGNLISGASGYSVAIKGASEDTPAKFTVTEGTYKAPELIGNGSASKTAVGDNLKATITNSSGDSVEYDGNENTSSNSITLDGVTFNLTSVGTAKITGATDTSDLVGKIKNFVEDYNKLVTTLTKYTSENKDRNYAVLTDDQKKEMTDTEIEKWNEKVMQGQFKDDYDISSILNKLTSCVDTAFSTLSYSEKESIGITQSSDWTTTSKNNLVIDESKLSEAISEDPDKIISLFNDSKTGIMNQMKSVISDEFVYSSNSALIKKAGYEGTAYFTQNTLTKQISDYNTKISEMEDDLSDREQALYSKWSTIETTMQKLNAQLSNLQSYFS